ncbi:MAG TPA: hypothetical protein VFU36_13515, partial [Jatrophihabitans sp.]|nr:hypothetical protein [Jatrophihabitans sp.]
AAASLAIGIAATIAVTAAAQQAHDHTLSGGNLPADQLIVWLADPNEHGSGPGLSVVPAGAPTGTPAVPNPAVVANARTTAAAIGRALGSATTLELDVAVDENTPVPAGAPPDDGRASLVRPVNDEHGQGWTQIATPYVATPAVLDFYRVTGAGSSDILSARRDLTGIELGTGFKGDFHPATVAVSSLLPNYTSAPNTLITPRAMTRLGLTAVPAGWLIRAEQPLTGAQLADARHRAALAGIAVETRTGPDHSLQRLREYATGAGVLVALGVLAMTVGLIRSESVGDLRTLTATGASGTTRRMLNGATAGALALLGGILGTAGAYLALIAWHWHHLGYLDRPPYLDLAVLILGLPVVAFAGAWLLGRTPRALARSPLE